MTNFEAQQADHQEHQRQVERDDAVAQLVAAVVITVKEIKNEWLYQTGQFSRVESPPANYPPQGSMHGGF